MPNKELVAGPRRPGQENSQPIKDSPEFKRKEPIVPEFAGGDGIIKGSPGSSVSCSQSPGLWKRLGEAAVNEDEMADREHIYKRPAKRIRKKETPVSTEPLSKLDMFLGIDPSIKALAKKVKATGRLKDGQEANVKSQKDLFAPKRLESIAEQREANTFGNPKPASGLNKNMMNADDSNENGFLEAGKKRIAPGPAIAWQEPIHNKPAFTTRPVVAAAKDDDDDDDDDFFSNLFKKAGPSPKVNGVSHSVMAALDQAQSPPPTPVKPSNVARNDTSRELVDELPKSPTHSPSCAANVQRQSPSPARRPSSPTIAMDRSRSPERSKSPSPPPLTAKNRASYDTSPEAKPRYSWNSRSDTAAARNPLARLKDDLEAVFDRTSQPTQTSNNMDDDDLWDDEEEEVKVSTPKKKNARAKRVTSAEKPKAPTRRRSEQSASPIAESKPAPKPRGAPASNGVSVAQRQLQKASEPDPLVRSRIVASDDKYSSDNLIPEFEIAKFYDPEAGPLEIGPDEANRFYVPASISRYLLPYQREGVEFMASALVDYGGTLLGTNKRSADLTIEWHFFVSNARLILSHTRR